jgi:anti-sigma B factor antagonist
MLDALGRRARSDWGRANHAGRDSPRRSAGVWTFRTSELLEIPVSYLSAFRVVVESVEDACLLRVGGELDAASAPDLSMHLRGASRDAGTTLVDLANVSFIDSAGLRVLLDESAAAAEIGHVVFVVRPSAVVRRLIHVTGSSGGLAVVPPSGDLSLLRGYA